MDAAMMITIKKSNRSSVRYLRQLLLITVGYILFLKSPALNANVVGTDLQNFNTTTSGIDYATVEASETLEMGIFNFGFSANHAINSLPVYVNEEDSQNRFSANDTLSTLEYNIGLGLHKNLEVGFSIGEIIRSETDNSEENPNFNVIGRTNFRYSAKVKVWSNNKYGLAIAGSVVQNRIQKNPYLGDSQGTINNLLLIGDSKFLGFSLATNIGYRWRKASLPLPDTIISPTRDQFFGSFAASYLISGLDTKVFAEVFGSRPTKTAAGSNSTRQASSAEAIGGIKYDITSNISTYAGAGTEMIHGASSPDWRAFAGINWSVGPTFGRKDKDLNFTEHPPAAKETIVLHSIQFKFASDNKVLPGSLAIIGKIVERILKPPEYKKIVIEGHTDSVGSAKFNLSLSKRRADTIRRVLIKKFKLDPKRIFAKGFGESTPIANNGNYQGRKKNRRVEITISR